MTVDEVLAHCVPEPNTGCLLYLGATSGGYPKAWVNGLGDRRLHPIVCEHFHGPKPSPAHQVCHRCDVRLCLAEQHLVWGTQLENMDGTHGRGLRGAKHHYWHHPSYPFRGTGNGHAKLTEDDVRAIRADPRPQRQIARDYGVGQFCVWSIKQRRHWRHLE